MGIRFTKKLKMKIIEQVEEKTTTKREPQKERTKNSLMFCVFSQDVSSKAKSLKVKVKAKKNQERDLRIDGYVPKIPRREKKNLMKMKRASSTLRASQAVPHPSTDRALQRLTLEFG